MTQSFRSSSLPRHRPGAPASDIGLTASRVDALQREAMSREAPRLDDDGPADPAASGLSALIAWHRGCNRLRRDLEAQLRQPGLSPAELPGLRRAIEGCQRGRHDALEAVDETLLAADCPPRLLDDAWLHDHSPGGLVDRLSINLLRLHRTGLLAWRADAGPADRQRHADALVMLQAQRSGLLSALHRLLEGWREGRCHFQVHRPRADDDDVDRMSEAPAPGAGAGR